jgi:hypothetical protein
MNATADTINLVDSDRTVESQGLEAAAPTPTRMPSRRSTRLGIRGVIGSVALAALVLGSSASSTLAYSWSTTGSSGSATLYNANGYYDPYNPLILAPLQTVKESPAYARYDQTVCVTHRLWRLESNGSQWWAHQGESDVTNCKLIRASDTSASFEAVAFSPRYGDTIIPYYGYSIDEVISWRLSNGSVVATLAVDYNLASDYICRTFKCATGTSTVGGFIRFDF